MSPKANPQFTYEQAVQWKQNPVNEKGEKVNPLSNRKVNVQKDKAEELDKMAERVINETKSSKSRSSVDVAEAAADDPATDVENENEERRLAHLWFAEREKAAVSGSKARNPLTNKPLNINGKVADNLNDRFKRFEEEEEEDEEQEEEEEEEEQEEEKEDAVLEAGLMTEDDKAQFKTGIKNMLGTMMLLDPENEFSGFSDDDACVKELDRFLTCNATYLKKQGARSVSLTPSRPVDMLWCILISSTRLYTKLCERALGAGKFMHRDYTDSDAAFNHTLRLLSSTIPTFGKVDNAFWGQRGFHVLMGPLAYQSLKGGRDSLVVPKIEEDSVFYQPIAAHKET